MNSLAEIAKALDCDFRGNGNLIFSSPAEPLIAKKDQIAIAIDKKFENQLFETKAKGLRGSIMIIGPLLSRFGKASIPKPGGDKIGRRKLDTHFEGLVKLGANFKYDNKNYRYNVTANKLKGSYILLDQPSVTGTANIIMTAALANGETTIYNAACEPYIQQLCSTVSYTHLTLPTSDQV